MSKGKLDNQLHRGNGISLSPALGPDEFAEELVILSFRMFRGIQGSFPHYCSY